MSLIFALLAGILLPFTNWTVRKSLDVGGNTKGYFIFQMLSSLFLAYLFGPVRTGDYSITLPAALIGSLSGVVIFLMLVALGKALEKGPPGLTFAVLNSASVMPGLLMALLFGTALGYDFKLSHAIGCLLVLGGLFWAGRGLQGMKEVKSWLLFSAVMFFGNLLVLAIFQWRALLLNPARPKDLFPFFAMDLMKSECFIPFMFLTSGILWLWEFSRTEKRSFKRGEILYGLTGGISNFLSTVLLLAAAVVASPLENAIIYPLFSVIGIILTNAWGQKLYAEKVNWRACQLCAFGLIVGTVDWKTVAAAIGF